MGLATERSRARVPLAALLLVLLAAPLLALDCYEVRVAEGIVARIRCKGDVATLLERGNRIDARLTEIISYEPCKKPNVHIEDENGIPVIYVGSHVLMRVFGGDAAPNNCTPQALAKTWKGNLIKWLPHAPSVAARPRTGAEHAGPTFVGPAIGDAGRVDLPPGAYTGLVIDATGLGAKRAISPKLVAPNGKEVWGTVQCSAAWAISYGIAAWVHGMEQASASVRAGSKPLVVKAAQVLGVHRCVLQISAEDVVKVLEANSVGHFLDNCNVVIVQ